MYVLQKVVMYMGAKLLQSCLTLCDHMDCSPPGSSVHGILQARIPEWIAMPSSRAENYVCMLIGRPLRRKFYLEVACKSSDLRAKIYFWCDEPSTHEESDS